MKSFEYFAPRELDEALDILKKGGENICILAGGTDVLVQLRHKKIAPDLVVDLTKINDLNYIKEEDGFIRIGACTTFTDIEKSSLINSRASVLAEACREIGSPQIRNRGTIGGNIANASPAADSVPALIALGAKAVIKSVCCTREAAVEDVLAGISRTNLKRDEVITEVFFKTPNEYTSSAFRKLGRRAALSIARISIALVMEKYPDKPMYKDARVALGAVAQNPFRAEEAESLLINRELGEEEIKIWCEKVSELAAKTLGNRASAPFKKESIKGIAEEVLLKVIKAE
jgi:CO/xanthine dehydrogenase FAD-binding subunit